MYSPQSCVISLPDSTHIAGIFPLKRFLSAIQPSISYMNGVKRLYYLSEYALVYINIYICSPHIKILLPFAGFSITLCHYMLYIYFISLLRHKERFSAVLLSIHLFISHTSDQQGKFSNISIMQIRVFWACTKLLETNVAKCLECIHIFNFWKLCMLL